MCFTDLLEFFLANFSAVNYSDSSVSEQWTEWTVCSQNKKCPNGSNWWKKEKMDFQGSRFRIKYRCTFKKDPNSNRFSATFWRNYWMILWTPSPFNPSRHTVRHPPVLSNCLLFSVKKKQTKRSEAKRRSQICFVSKYRASLRFALRFASLRVQH